mmetsp:Transcript_61324/g.168316  ORF Transcript_61324/g.168316 Transcript_61324/m.168316 type:complete len:334 (-) Transcript_61324:141-1142(-)
MFGGSGGTAESKGQEGAPLLGTGPPSRQEEEDLKSTLKGLSYLKPVYTKIAEEEKNIVQQKKKKEENKRAAEKWETDKKGYFAFFCSLPFLIGLGVFLFLTYYVCVDTDLVFKHHHHHHHTHTKTRAPTHEPTVSFAPTPTPEPTMTFTPTTTTWTPTAAPTENRAERTKSPTAAPVPPPSAAPVPQPTAAPSIADSQKTETPTLLDGKTTSPTLQPSPKTEPPTLLPTAPTLLTTTKKGGGRRGDTEGGDATERARRRLAGERPHVPIEVLERELVRMKRDKRERVQQGRSETLGRGSAAAEPGARPGARGGLLRQMAGHVLAKDAKSGDQR